MPTRPEVSTLNTVSNWSQLVLLIDSVPLDWVKLRLAPLRRSVTRVTWYGLSRRMVVAPCAPSFQLPPGIPPDMNPPPSQPPMDSQILSRYPLAKLLKLAWLDGNFPFTMAVSASSDLTDEPAFMM